MSVEKVGQKTQEQTNRYVVGNPLAANSAFRTGIGLVGLCVLVLLYREITSAYWHNDDILWISNGRFDMHLGNILSFRVVGFFRPLINLSFFIQERLFPGNIPVYYYSNLAIHYANTVLVYFLLRCIVRDRRVAICAAFLFLITTVHYTAVVWISARTTLISSFFVLLSLVVLLHWRRPQYGLAAAIFSYVLALAAKETAVAGFMIVALLFLYGRRLSHVRASLTAVAAYGAVTVAYLGIRIAAIGHLAQEDWSPGLHMLTNIAGGVLYQIYPWYLVAVTGKGALIAESTHVFWPEILVIPIVVVVLWLARRSGRFGQAGLLITWMFVCLIPVSLFKVRFFSTALVTADRYYYLSSVGLCALLGMLLFILWDSRQRNVVMRALAVSFLFLIIAGETARVSQRHDFWARLTERSRYLLSAVEPQLQDHTPSMICMIEEPSPSRPYIMHGLKLKYPEWTVRPVLSQAEAFANRPCVYLKIESNGKFSVTRQEFE